ncbi:ribonuclease kappa [Epargyreus clarus]|uniref:ribonuclease kappa n=1 Tax=Epargyreus clarus TaxID=520877 RepID=UPI003C2BA1FA
MACKLCGPKLSLCGFVLSIWGIIQLTLMGVFYYIRAVALLEDLPLEEGGHHNDKSPIDNFIADVEAGYTRNAYNCWIAALLYVITLVISGHQFWMNNRSSVSM